MAITRRPEIFISATSRDLGSSRQLMRDAVLTLGCVPVLQDHFTPNAGTVREILRSKIAACDAVVHLAGECYGYEPQKRDPGEPRRSYTQLEYDIARELKKPLYVFLCADGFPYDAHEPEVEELRRLQQQHRSELIAGDDLYLPVNDAHDLALRVRELQTRLEHLTHDLKKTRSWLGGGVVAALVALALFGGALWVQHQRGKQIEQKITQISGELKRYRPAIEALADRYGQDMEASGRRLTAQEKFDRALAAVAEQQKINIDELKTWMQVFVTQVRANPGADLYDRALADFAEQRFAESATNATKSAEQYQVQREAGEKEAAGVSARVRHAAEKERRSWTLAGDAELAAGHYPAAIEPYRKALALTDENKEPLPWCDAAQKLEVALQRQGVLKEAEPLARQVVDRRTALQGAEHAEALTSLINLALLVNQMGNYAEAEPMFRRALEALGRTLGKEHIETLRCNIDFAGLLYRQSHFVEAESLYREAIQTAERTLGKDHMYALGSVANLATVRALQGEYAEAESLARRALEGVERKLGKEHPWTLNTLSGLSRVLREKGDFFGAEQLCRRVLEVQERLLGQEHNSTVTSVIDLGFLLGELGEYAEAEALYRRALEPLERTLGKEHPETLRCINHLGRVLCYKGEYAEAETLCRLALTGRERKLGKEHEDTLYSVMQLAKLLRNNGRFAEAEPLCRDALEILKRTSGKEAVATLECMTGLANVLTGKGDDNAAESLYQHALQGQERVLGKGHPDTAETAYNFSLLRKKGGRFKEAQALAEEAVQGTRASLPESHPNRRKYAEHLQALASLVKAR